MIRSFSPHNKTKPSKWWLWNVDSGEFSGDTGLELVNK